MTEKDDICFATFARNEKIRLPIWLKHYQQFISDKHIYVIDQNTTDGSIDNLPCNIINEPHEGVFDHVWLRNMLTKNLSILLKKYKIVVLTECDELMFTKDNTHLKDYLVEYYSNNSINGATLLYDVVQYNDEPDYDPTKPISKQRNFWRPWGMYKHTIHTSLSNLENGFHSGNGVLNDNLTTIHIQLLNTQFFKDKITQRLAEKNKYGAGDSHICWTVHYKTEFIESYLNEMYQNLTKVSDFFTNNKFI